MMLRLRIELSLWGQMGIGGGQEDLVGGGNTCFFNIGASYIDVFTL